MKKLAIVVPCYNEEKRLPVADFLRFGESREKEIEIFFVNDGSKDNTLQLIQDLETNHSWAHALDFGENKGKAEAVRCAMLEVEKLNSFEYIGFLDADLATPLTEMDFLVKSAEFANAPIKYAFGSRFARLGSNIHREKLRHYMGRTFATLISIMLQLQVYDTQCGAKIMHHSWVSDIMKNEFVSKWFFDVEILFRIMNKMGRLELKKQVIEVPLNSWVEMGDSRLNSMDFITAPFELLKIYKHYNKKR